MRNSPANNQSPANQVSLRDKTDSKVACDGMLQPRVILVHVMGLGTQLHSASSFWHSFYCRTCILILKACREGLLHFIMPFLFLYQLRAFWLWPGLSARASGKFTLLKSSGVPAALRGERHSGVITQLRSCEFHPRCC